MRSLSIFVLVASLGLGGCSASRKSVDSARLAEPKSEALKDQPQTAELIKESFNQTERAISIEAAMDRKIVRDADLTIEVNSTTEAQQQVSKIAESHGGFVVTSESKQRENSDPTKRTVDVKLVVRVPSPQFEDSLQQIEGLATNLPHRSVNGQDVSEEFIDIEARIKTQKALELQFLEIMKQATKVTDALEVQRQAADVRTEIEKLEGRKRFLENRSSLSTITVNIQTPMPIVVSASGFSHTVREAVSESLELATGMVLFFVRFVIVITPILLLVVLPLSIVGLYFRRRALRLRLAHELEANPISD